MFDRDINLYAVPADYIEKQAKKISHLERSVKATRRSCGLALILIFGLAYDVYETRKELKKQAKQAKKSDE